MPSETTLNHALVALFEHIASSDKPIIIDYCNVQKWQSGALESFLRLGLISPASMAQSIECKGCENHCFMDVITYTKKSITRAFIVCDDSEMQSQMGRIKIPLERLNQWKSSSIHLAKVISNLLELNDNTEQTTQDKIRLGMMKSPKGRRWVCYYFSLYLLKLTNIIFLSMSFCILRVSDF